METWSWRGQDCSEASSLREKGENELSGRRAATVTENKAKQADAIIISNRKKNYFKNLLMPAI